jgi:hypothetical protein
MGGVTIDGELQCADAALLWWVQHSPTKIRYREKSLKIGKLRQTRAQGAMHHGLSKQQATS